jgi:Insertion element 4 transposase N-terminal/Transposase DDE domain
LSGESVITRTVRVAQGVFAPGHLGELTQVIDFDLVDAVLTETGCRERRTRLLPSRVMVYFVLALALFERCSYRAVWGKLTAGLAGLAVAQPAVSSLSRARRRVGTAPLRRLFETLAGPVAPAGQPGVFYRGLRTVAVDGTCLHVPDEQALTWRYPKRAGDSLEFGYPLLRLLALVECGTRALLAAAFGPEDTGELAYAQRLLGALDATMLLLADAGFEAAQFLHDVTAARAQFLVRSSARRCPTCLRRLPDGSCLARAGYRVLPSLMTVRVIEAAVTITLADGTTRREQWRLLTSLLDPTRYPARELVDLYHERWQAETTYYSIKATILDGRVLRSRSLPGIDQEVYALLAAYQALIRAAADTASTRPGLDMDRISFTIVLQIAGDLVTTASGVLPSRPIDLTGAIGRAALRALLPAWRRPRLKARSIKNPASKYTPNAGRHPATAQAYTFHADIMFFDEGLAPRQRT